MQSVKGKIYKYRADEWLRHKEEHKRSGKWNASSLGRCPRLQYLKRIGEKEEMPTIESMGRMRMGKDIEVAFIEEARKSGVNIYSVDENGEQDQLESESVIGRPDFYLVDDEIVGEIKTQNSRSFWKSKNNGNMLQKHHLYQVAWYMMMKGWKKGIVEYISRDDYVVEEIEVELTPQLKKEIQDRIKELDTYWDNQIIPPASPEGEWECTATWCPYYKKCKEIEKENK